MTTWLLGGNGMLGQAVQQQLQRHQLPYVSSGREVDVTDLAALQATAERLAPRHIINCAAYTKVDACETSQEEALAVNGTAPGHIAAVARRVGAAALHISTDYVFAGDGTDPYPEDAPCQPLGAYGHSKYLGEQNFWAAGAGEAPSFVVRTSWLFGHRGNNFVRTMLRLMGEREQLRVVADQLGRPTFCDDLAAAILDLMGLSPGTAAAPGGTYHFANHGATSWHGFAQGIAALARQHGAALRCRQVEPIKTVDFPTPARRPAYSVLCTRKISAVLPQPPRPWEQALESYLAKELAADAN